MSELSGASQNSNGFVARIVPVDNGDGEQLLRELQPFVGMVVDVSVNDGTLLAGVVVAVSRTSVFLEGWDVAAGRPNGDLLTVELDAIECVSVF